MQALDYFEAAAEPTHTQTLWLVLGTCFLALLVNFCSFGLIGRTSPITFQVVGHAKTCLVLIGGYVLFPAKAQDTQQFYNNIAGVSVRTPRPARPRSSAQRLAFLRAAPPTLLGRLPGCIHWLHFIRQR